MYEEVAVTKRCKMLYIIYITKTMLVIIITYVFFPPPLFRGRDVSLFEKHGLLTQVYILLVFHSPEWPHVLLSTYYSPLIYPNLGVHVKGHAVAWLRHYTTSLKFMGSIPDEVIEFFNWPNPSSCTVALGSTQPLTEMRTRNFPAG
jgi:hypothetical protein